MIDLTQLHPFFFGKIAVLLLLFLYAIFAFVVITQIRAMNKLVQQPPIGSVLEIIGWIHIILAASLFLLGLAIL